MGPARIGTISMHAPAVVPAEQLIMSPTVLHYLVGRLFGYARSFPKAPVNLHYRRQDKRFQETEIRFNNENLRRADRKNPAEKSLDKNIEPA